MRTLLIITASVLALASASNFALGQSINPNPMVESNPNPAVQPNENAIGRQHRNSMAQMKVRQRVSTTVSALENTIRELQLSPDGFGGRKGLALASSRQALADLKRVLEYRESADVRGESPVEPLYQSNTPANREHQR
jgi:hypothetical protein